MEQLLLDLECKALDFPSGIAPARVVASLDQVAAFPSISRQFIMWVNRMRLPRGIRKLMKCLFDSCMTSICVNGQVFEGFLMEPGVGHGVPLFDGHIRPLL